MLVLTRKLGESIIIGDNIKVTIVDLGQGRVRIGIEAPGEVPIHREELLQTTQEQPATAEQAPTPPAAPVQLHNRLTGKFPAPLVPPATPMSETSTQTLENRLKKLRRKPR